MIPEDLQWALDTLQKKQADCVLYESYMAGAHRLDFVPSEFRRDFAALLRRARLNMIPAVVTSVRDRLKLTGLTSDTTENKIEDAISNIWRANRLDYRSGEVHGDALVCGESFVIAWPNMEGDVVIYPNRALLVCVRYSEDAPDRVDLAAKKWQTDDKKVRLTLYYSDRIEKYITKGRNSEGSTLKPGSFIEFESETESPVMMNPYDIVPVFRFGDGDTDLHEAIPVQDMMNKTVRDSLVGGENMSLPQRWATGVQAAIDPTTKQPVNQWSPGDFWSTPNKDAAFGQLEAANLDQLKGQVQMWMESMAAVTGTPMHYFLPTGEVPSGEALKTLEFRLASKVMDRQTSFGNSWEDVFAFSLKILGMEDVYLDAVWRDTQPRNDVEYQTAVIERVEKLGLSMRQGLRELQYGDEEIDRIYKEQAAVGVVEDLAGVAQ